MQSGWRESSKSRAWEGFCEGEEAAGVVRVLGEGLGRGYLLPAEGEAMRTAAVASLATRWISSEVAREGRCQPDAHQRERTTRGGKKPTERKTTALTSKQCRGGTRRGVRRKGEGRRRV